jgi:uncharacterized membrane protein YdfJ with MMPL/SSD domain
MRSTWARVPVAQASVFIDIWKPYERVKLMEKTWRTGGVVAKRVVFHSLTVRPAMSSLSSSPSDAHNVSATAGIVLMQVESARVMSVSATEALIAGSSQHGNTRDAASGYKHVSGYERVRRSINGPAAA